MIAEHECDLVILMARKALCLYRMMQICGAKPLRVPVFSDAILESNGQFLRGKKVLVVDDTLFVGTTLSDTVDRLNELTVAAQTWVYAADAETWKKKTFSPDYIHVQLSAQDAIEFCSAECRSLINAGIPYLTDFAASQRIRLTPAELDGIIKPVNWAFHDISSQYHDKSMVKYYSALPDQYVLQKVKKIVGQSIFDLIEIAKIRIFATWAGRTYDVTFVPLVTFAPCKSASLRRASVLLGSAFGIPRQAVCDQSAADQMRMLQFLVGAAFMKSMWEHIEVMADLSAPQKLSHDWCGTVFCPELAEYISSGILEFYNATDGDYSIRGRLPVLATDEPESVVQETQSDVDTFLDVYFSKCDEMEFGDSPLSDLTAIMLEFQAHFEDRARREVIEGDPNPKYRDRLRRGMAWRALSKRLLERYHPENTRHREKMRHHRNVLSLFLDRLVDFGIAVPIITHIDGLIYRAYRHGEDVRFGAQEESLVYHLLEGFQVGRENEGFEATYFEKLIVILLRVGMDEEWLNLWYSNSGRDNLVRIGYHLQGAVSISPRNDNELVPEGETSWLTRRLCKTGTIKIKRGKRNRTYYGLGKRPAAAHARIDAPRTAKQLGHALGKLCVSGSNTRSNIRPLGSEDLIVLTSCSNAIDVAGAIAAELHIFDNWFDKSGSRALNGDFSMPEKSIFKQNFAQQHGSQAFNSASWKIKKYQAKEIDDIKLKVYATEKIDPEFFIRKDIWNTIFSSFERHANDHELKKINAFLSAASDLIVCFKFLFRAVVCIVKIVREPDSLELRQKLTSLVHEKELPPLTSFTGVLEAIDRLDEQMPTESVLRKLREVASAVDGYGKMICVIAREESVTAQSIVLKADVRLSRKEYRYLVWYDVLNSRVRGIKDPDEADRYSEATENFRDEISTMLEDFKENIQNSGGNVFVQSGDISSRNDEKHIFLSGKGSQAEVANVLVNNIKRVVDRTGVRLRMLAIPTNLRGNYVFLNRGQTDIGGDFLSHAHTLIQSVKDHKLEKKLHEGESVIWILKEHKRFFHGIGSVSLKFQQSISPVKVKVVIRKMRSDNILVALS